MSKLPKSFAIAHDRALAPSEHGDEGAKETLMMFEALTIAWAALEHVAQWPEYDPRAEVARKAQRAIRRLSK